MRTTRAIVTLGLFAGASLAAHAQSSMGTIENDSGIKAQIQQSTERQAPRTDFGAVLNQGAQKNLVAVPATPAPRPVVPTLPVQPIIVPKPVIQSQPAQRAPVPVVRSAPTPVMRR